MSSHIDCELERKLMIIAMKAAVKSPMVIESAMRSRHPDVDYFTVPMNYKDSSRSVNAEDKITVRQVLNYMKMYEL